MTNTVYTFLLDDVIQDKVYLMIDSEKQKPSQETVLVTRSSGSSRGQQAPGQQTRDKKELGVKARGHKASQTLGLALSSKKRQPKPRSMGTVDKLVWSDAQMKAEKELESEFEIAVSLDEYYKTTTVSLQLMFNRSKCQRQ